MLIDGLLRYFACDDAAPPLLDSAIGLDVGTPANGAALVDGGFRGRCLDIPAGGVVSTTDPRRLSPDPVSIAAHVYLTQLPSAMAGGYPKVITALGDGVNEGFFLGSLSGDDVTFLIVDTAGSIYSATTTLVAGDLNRWVHLCGVHTPTSVTLFKDGVQVDTALADGSIKYPAGTPLEAGINWEGRIDEIAIWDRSLDEASLGEVSEAAAGIVYPDTISPIMDVSYIDVDFYPQTLSDLADQTGNPLLVRTPFTSPTGEDTSGNGQHATIHGGVTVPREYGNAFRFTNPAGDVDITDYLTYPDLGTVAADRSMRLHFQIRTTDDSQQNGRVLATRGSQGNLVEPGIWIAYNDTVDNSPTVVISDGTHVLTSSQLGRSITDGDWHTITVLIDRNIDRAAVYLDDTLFGDLHDIGSLGAVPLTNMVVGGWAIPGEAGDFDQRGAIADVDLITVETWESVRSPLEASRNILILGLASVDLEAGYMDAPFTPLERPRNPNPDWVNLFFDTDTSEISSTISYGPSDPTAIARYWEIEIVPGQAYMRVDASYPDSISRTANREIALSFQPPPQINLNGTRLRYVIEDQAARERLWATDWMKLGDGGIGPEPGPQPDGYPAFVFVNIVDWTEGQPFEVARLPDILGAEGSAVDYTWNRITQDGEDLGPEVLDDKAGPLVLKDIRPGRFRYRITAQWPATDEEDASIERQDYLLYVWRKPGDPI